MRNATATAQRRESHRILDQRHRSRIISKKRPSSREAGQEIRLILKTGSAHDATWIAPCGKRIERCQDFRGLDVPPSGERDMAVCFRNRDRVLITKAVDDKRSVARASRRRRQRSAGRGGNQYCRAARH